MLRRRPLLIAAPAAIAAVAVGAPRFAAARGPGSVPLRLGADRSLAASGLAASLQRGFGASTGIAVKLVIAPALAVLDAVRDGEVDAALANAPAAESVLETQSLVFERHRIAIGDFVLVGPAPRPKSGAAAGRSTGSSPEAALARIRELTDAQPQHGIVFLTPNDGSGAHLAEQALWRSAAIEPKPPWYVAAKTGAPFLRQVRDAGGFAIVERGEWLAEGGAPLAILAEGGPVLAEAVHVMRSFRASHPAGKLFSSWVGDGRGRSVVARQRGYRVAG